VEQFTRTGLRLAPLSGRQEGPSLMSGDDFRR